MIIQDSVKSSHLAQSSYYYQKIKIAKVEILLKLRPKACNFDKKDSLAEVFSCEFYEISKNTFFTEHPRRLLLM